jgi:hypothetical protein
MSLRTPPLLTPVAIIALGVAAASAILTSQTAVRQRPPMAPIKAPVMFDTPEADRILAALQVFPPDNPWNQDISESEGAS